MAVAGAGGEEEMDNEQGRNYLEASEATASSLKS